MSRLASYKTSDDIFLTEKRVKKGNRHGALILLDWSGSMGNVIDSVVYQAIAMARAADLERRPYWAFSGVKVTPFSSSFHVWSGNSSGWSPNCVRRWRNTQNLARGWMPSARWSRSTVSA